MLPEADIVYFKHVILGKTKKFFKDLYAKGPDNLSIKITDDIIVLQFAGILRMAELELVNGQAESAELVLSYRRVLFQSQKDIFIQEIEEIINRKVIDLVFETNIFNNSAWCFIILNRPV